MTCVSSFHLFGGLKLTSCALDVSCGVYYHLKFCSSDSNPSLPDLYLLSTSSWGQELGLPMFFKQSLDCCQSPCSVLIGPVGDCCSVALPSGGLLGTDLPQIRRILKVGRYSPGQFLVCQCSSSCRWKYNLTISEFVCLFNWLREKVFMVSTKIRFRLAGRATINKPFHKIFTWNVNCMSVYAL